MKFDDNLPFVTIGMPAYNHERYVGEALGSAAAQTYPNLDLLIIDDGSTDGTFSRIQEFAKNNEKRFRNIDIHTRPNRGIVGTMNEMLDRCRTSWLFVCASDDVMYENRVAAQVEFMQGCNEPELALILGQIDWIDSEGNLLPEPPVKYPAAGVYRDAFLGFLATNPTPGSTTAIRIGAARAVGGYDDSLPYEDWAMALELAVRYPVGFVDKRIGAYRRHDTNQSDPENYGQALWLINVTTARFLARHGDKVPHDFQAEIYRKNILRAIRYFRKRNILAAFRLFMDLLLFKMRRPTHHDLQRYAEWLKQSLHT